MALTGGHTYEFRPDTGSNDNGGAFNRFLNPVSGVDYSRQDGPELDLSDLSTSAAGVLYVSSATGGFTKPMVGNLMKVNSGTNFVSGWYEIKEWVSSNQVKLDRTPSSAGAGSSGAGRVGGALKFFENEIVGVLASAFSSDCTMWIAPGVMTVPKNVYFYQCGWNTFIRGYNTNRDGNGDEPKGNNRPTLDFRTSPGFEFYNAHASIHNLRILNSDHRNAGHLANAILTNCEIVSCTTSGVYPFDTYGAKFIDCEFDNVYSSGNAKSSMTGGIIQHTDGNSSPTFLGCWFHDCDRGFSSNGTIGPRFSNCVFSNMGTGILTWGYTPRVITNTFHDLMVGIYNWTRPFAMVVVNNLFSECISGIYGVEHTPLSFVDYNNFWNCDQRGNCDMLDHNFSADPMLVDPSGGDFTIGAASPSIGLGFTIQLGVG